VVKESVSVENHQTPTWIQLAWSSINFVKYCSARGAGKLFGSFENETCGPICARI